MAEQRSPEYNMVSCLGLPYFNPSKLITCKQATLFFFPYKH